MKKHKRIWLQNNPDEDTTWCQDKINDEDIEYTRADLYASLERRNEELVKAGDAAILSAYESGYNAGHNDTIEGCFSLAGDEAALEWFADASEEDCPIAKWKEVRGE